MRAWWRRLRFGLSTILGLKPLGFFIPYRYAGSTEALDYPALVPLFNDAAPRFREVLSEIERHSEGLRRIASGNHSARFGQDWFPRLDAAAAYALVMREAPRRIVEVGSGHSTRFLAAAVADGGLSTAITCIDPAPRAPLSGLCVQHVSALLSQADPAIFGALESGDILFIDSSHVAMPGTDVDRLFLDVLPRLKRGVLVHVHDVTLPDAYPPAWAWRGYNEQLLVAALIQGGGYELVFASHYVARTLLQTPALAILAELPLPTGAVETSLWMQKR
jgi:hypothetical protein